jgi:hypothetical protein
MFTYYYNNVEYQTDTNHYITIKYSKLHRDNDLPAIIWPKGSREWFKRGKCHRDGNKPAIIWIANNGKFQSFEWWKNDKRYQSFNLENLISLQIFIKVLYHVRFNKFIWSPNNLGGKVVKQQLLLLFKN